MSITRVFNVSLVPETCRGRFIDSKELINKCLESDTGTYPNKRQRYQVVAGNLERSVMAVS
jgi:hypothetical protein